MQEMPKGDLGPNISKSTFDGVSVQGQEIWLRKAANGKEENVMVW